MKLEACLCSPKAKLIASTKFLYNLQQAVLVNGLIGISSNPGLAIYLGDNCIQNFHLGRYIVGYTVGNLVLRPRLSGALKCDFQTYIRQYTSPNEIFEYGYPHCNALLQFRSGLESWKPHVIQ